VDPMHDDAERLERALAAWQDGQDPQGVFDALPPQLRPAAFAALGLGQAGVGRAAGARPSFVTALEDQLRADLRIGLDRPSAAPQPAATVSPRALRLALAAVLLGLLAGYGLRGKVAPAPVTPVEAPSRALDPVAAAPDGPSLTASSELPWLAGHAPLPPVLIAAVTSSPTRTVFEAAPAAADGLAPPAPGPATVPVVATAAALPPAEVADPPDEPVVAAVEEEETERPAPPTSVGDSGPTAAPPQEAPPLRTPDVEPEP
jgi:hypothetical protein